MNNQRNWTVLFIGGASGTGKSTLAYEMARFYGVNVMEVDDVNQTVKAVTTKDTFPAIHYWDSGINWLDIGAEGCVKWLTDVSNELAPALKALADRHIEDKLPIIIEGDFINPEFVKSFDNPEIKAIFVHEPDKNQILQNYLAREGGDLQHYRAEISVLYNNRLADICRQNEIALIEARPWDTALNRTIECLENS